MLSRCGSSQVSWAVSSRTTEGDLDGYRASSTARRDRLENESHVGERNVNGKANLPAQLNASLLRSDGSLGSGAHENANLGAQHKACMLRSDGSLGSGSRPNSLRRSQSLGPSWRESTGDQISPRNLFSDTDLERGEDTHSSNGCPDSEGASVSVSHSSYGCRHSEVVSVSDPSHSSLPPLLRVGSYQTTFSRSQGAELSRTLYNTEPIFQLHSASTLSTRKAIEPRARCHVRHESSPDVRTLASTYDGRSSDSDSFPHPSVLSQPSWHTVESDQTAPTLCQGNQCLDAPLDTELIRLLQEAPKSLSKKLLDPRAGCHSKHEIASSIRTLATRGYAERLLENGALQALLAMTASCSCCQSGALRALQGLFRFPMSTTMEVDCQTGDTSKLKKLMGFLRRPKCSLLGTVDQHEKAVKQLMSIIRSGDSGDAVKQDAVDFLRLFVLRASCCSIIKKYSVSSELLIALAGARSEGLLQSLVQFLCMLPQQMLVASSSALYNAIPALTGLLLSSHLEVVLATLTVLEHALPHDKMFCQEFVEKKGVTLLEPLLYSNRTAKTALKLMCLVASHPCTHRHFINNRSLVGLLAVTEYAEQDFVLQALGLLTTLARCNRECGLELIQLEAVPALQGLEVRGDRLVARSAVLALQAIHAMPQF